MKSLKTTVFIVWIVLAFLCPVVLADEASQTNPDANSDSSTTKNWEFSLAPMYLWAASIVIPAQEDDPPKPSDDLEQQSPSPDEQEPINGYPVRKRRIGGPTDVEWDLDNSFPKRGSVLELILPCQESAER
mgnify:CR=1 FL=1